MTQEDAAALPDPPIPAEVEVLNLHYMPLHIRRLLTSDTWIDAADNPKVGHALMCLWCESWHQVPAGSIPGNEKVLARLAMCDLGTWERIRDKVLRDWTLCNDGRYYHRVVAKLAMDAWDEKQSRTAQTEAARLARLARLDSERLDSSVTSGVTYGVTGDGCDVTGDVTRDGLSVTSRDGVTGSALRMRRHREKLKQQKQALTASLSNSDCHSVSDRPCNSGNVIEGNVKKRRTKASVTGDALQVSMLVDETATGAASSALPEWLPAEEWEAYVAHRKHVKSPLSEEGQRRAIAMLDRLRDEGNDVRAVIDQSIVNGWKGLFAVRGDRRQQQDNGGDRVDRMLKAVAGAR